MGRAGATPAMTWVFRLQGQPSTGGCPGSHLSSFLCKPNRCSQQRNRNQIRKMRRLQKRFIGGLLLGTAGPAGAPCSCWDLPLLLFAASSSCLSSKKAHSDHGGDPWGYYCTMGKAATTAAGRDAEEVIFLLVSLIQILLWKMNQTSLGFFPEASLTNFVQNSQADPAQQYDSGRQDLLTFGWRQGKTVLQACPKKSSG